MWFIVKTEKFKEQSLREAILGKFGAASGAPAVVQDVYLPMCRTSVADGDRARFKPLIYGVLFVRMESFRALHAIVAPSGCFFLRGSDGQPEYINAYIPNAGRSDGGLEAAMRAAVVRDDEMERFVFYIDKVASGIEDLKIEEAEYDRLIAENDEVCLLDGPLKGCTGVVKQAKSGGGGAKSRFLLLRLGNCLCLRVPDARRYRMQIVHAASGGERAEEVGAWRAADSLVAFFQRQCPAEDACHTVRHLIFDYNRKANRCLPEEAARGSRNARRSPKLLEQRDAAIACLPDRLRPAFLALAGYFNTGSASDGALQAFLPSAPLRPFLTPADDRNAPAVDSLHHNSLRELMLKVDLSQYFKPGAEFAGEPSFPAMHDDFVYQAHYALLPDGPGRLKVTASWGGFCELYLSLGDEEREKLRSDLQRLQMPRFLELIDDPRIKFETVRNGLHAVTFEIKSSYRRDDVRTAAEAAEAILGKGSPHYVLLAAAAEIWQGTRMLRWRQLLQRSVLLHKVPVIDRPNVVETDEALNASLSAHNGSFDVVAAMAALGAKTAEINDCMQSQKLLQGVTAFLNAAKTVSLRFFADDHYNCLAGGYAPDEAMGAMFDIVSDALTAGPASRKQRTTAAGFLLRAAQELRELDAWRFFKFPSFLKRLSALEDIK
jgi:transcription antitermination factor NusG